MSQTTSSRPETATASVIASSVIASSARQMQLAIRARLLQNVTRLWPLLDAKRLDTTFPGWLRAMTMLVRSYRGQSAAAASAAYRAMREQSTQSPAPASLVKIAPEPDPEWLNRAFGYSGPGMLSRDTARPNTALTVTLGTASRVVLDAGRTTTLDTVKADPVAVGWYRVTDGKPCAFCALLASRGIVYKEHTVDFKAHNDCGCSGAPAFSRTQDLPDVSRRAAQVYANRGDGDPLVAFRKAWAQHLAEGI